MKNTVFVLANGSSSSRPRAAACHFYCLPLSKPVYYPQPGPDLLGWSTFTAFTLSLFPVSGLLGSCKKHWAARPQMRRPGMEKHRRVTLQATVKLDWLLEPYRQRCTYVCLCGRFFSTSHRGAPCLILLACSNLIVVISSGSHHYLLAVMPK